MLVPDLSAETLAAVGARELDRYDAMFLDVGNTLVGDPRPRAWATLAEYWSEAVITALRQADAQEGSPFVSHFWGEETICEQALGLMKSGVSFDPRRLLSDYRRAVVAAYRIDHRLAPVRGNLLVAVLEDVRRSGVRFVGVISNEQPGGPERFLADVLDVDPRAFDAIVTSSDLKVGKPDPGIFRYALALAGVDARCALHVGDSVLNDIIPARELGMGACQFIGLIDDSVSDVDWPVIADLRDLPALLRASTAPPG